MEEIKESELQKIRFEKDRLKNLITPAIQVFIKETGLIPAIDIWQVQEKTGCGVVSGEPQISIKVIL